LVDSILIHVANENNTTSKLERTWQIIIFHVCIPRDNTFTIRVQSTFKQIKGNWIFQNSITVIEYDNRFIVFKECSVETLGSGITLNCGKTFTSINNRTNLEISQIRDIFIAISFKSLCDSICLSETTFASNNSGWLDARSNHGNQLLNETESSIDVKTIRFFNSCSHCNFDVTNHGFYLTFNIGFRVRLDGLRANFGGVVTRFSVKTHSGYIHNFFLISIQ